MKARVKLALWLVRKELRVERLNAHIGHDQATSRENERYWMGRISGIERVLRSEFGEPQQFPTPGRRNA